MNLNTFMWEKLERLFFDIDLRRLDYNVYDSVFT